MIDGGFFVTPHAVARFRERIAPLDYEAARAAILTGMERAGPIKRTRNARAAYCRVRSCATYPYDFRAVLGPGEGPLPAVVSVLRSGKGRGGGAHA